ncbi:MAG: pantoate--beta-alanine ligase [Candidatus Omnitrophica bacterium]|nr:pantoate--beta-alanine ligase [Candidatus Omnitrophota bacterium]
MRIIKTIKALRLCLAGFRRKGKTIGFVPTMGYFHKGHISLMKASKKANDITVVSLFVNPLQFGPREDLAKYPRDFKRDSLMAKEAGVDILFCPSPREMYPGSLLTRISVAEMSQGLCGASRPGHFEGVATVVGKLLNIVQPDVMCLGQKDAQQVAVLKKMVLDLNFPLKLNVVPTVREPDGLAMSSRNVYLSPSERKEAPAIYRALKAARVLILSGELDATKINSKIKKLILEGTSASIEYISCVDPDSLKAVRRIKLPVMVAVAVRFSAARLIDNIVVTRSIGSP